MYNTHFRQRIISLLVLACMLVSCFPLSSLALNIASDTGDNSVAGLEDLIYDEDLGAYIVSLNDYSYIYVTAAAVEGADSYIWYTEDKDVISVDSIDPEAKIELVGSGCATVSFFAIQDQYVIAENDISFIVTESEKDDESFSNEAVALYQMDMQSQSADAGLYAVTPGADSSLTWSEIFEYARASSITSGNDYIIVYSSNGSYGYALTATAVNSWSAESGSITDNIWSFDEETASDYLWNIQSSGSSYIVKNKNIVSYLYPVNNSLFTSSTTNNLISINISNSLFTFYTTASNKYYSLNYSLQNSNFNIRNYNNFNNMSSATTNKMYLFASTYAAYALSGPASYTYKPSDDEAAIKAAIIANNKILYDTDSDHTSYSTLDITADMITVDLLNNTATITYNGWSATVSLSSRTVFSIEVQGTTEYVVMQNNTLNIYDTSLLVTYDDGTTATISVTTDMLSKSDTAVIGSYTADITYSGYTISNAITITVIENNIDDPIYPEEGAVSIDKTASVPSGTEFADTGVAKVELTVKGVPVRLGVDVILICDVSASMKDAINSSSTTTKWEALKTSLASFFSIFLSPYDDGTATLNTASLVVFGGYDTERTNSNYSFGTDDTKTLFVGCSDESTANNALNNYTITSPGCTNYDYAFIEAASAIKTLKENYAANNNGNKYDDSGRNIHIIFMTDGVPTNYNQVLCLYTSSSNFYYYSLYTNQADRDAGRKNFIVSNAISTYNKEIWGTSTSNTIVASSGGVNGYYMPKEGQSFSHNNWLNWIYAHPLQTAVDVQNITGVASITCVGFVGASSTNGVQSPPYTSDEVKAILANTTANTTSGETGDSVIIASDNESLSAFYNSMASKLKIAGTDATVTDTMGAQFDLNMTRQINGSNPTIQIARYSVYTRTEWIKANATATSSDDFDYSLIGTRKSNTPIVEELVTFGELNGKIVAYDSNSDLLTITYDSDNKPTIIYGKYFTYYTEYYQGTDYTPETFYWNIGDISESEISLSYYVYLTGSMEGQREKGSYDTNTEAILYYYNFLGHNIEKVFPIPSMPWGSAQVSYVFYLVNTNGEPVNSSGTSVSFANHVNITDIKTEQFELNSSYTLTASELLPAALIENGYTLYDNTAAYTVNLSNTTWNNTGVTTYVSNYNTDTPSAATNSTTKPNNITNISLLNTCVYFAVTISTNLIKDVIVVDYGLPVTIDVISNDLIKGSISGIAKNNGTIEINNPVTTASLSKAPVQGTYGTLSIVGDKLSYTMTSKIKEAETFLYEVYYTFKDGSGNVLTDEEGNVIKFFKCQTVTIIPATIMYYEDSYLTFETGWTSTGTSLIKNQDLDIPGVKKITADHDNNYGYDSAYLDNNTYSQGSAHQYTISQSDTAVTSATFNFTGNGFDIIGLTGYNTGVMLVEVTGTDFATNSEVNEKWFVNTYYGYATGEDGKLYTSDLGNLYQIPVIKSGDHLNYGNYTVTITPFYNKLFDPLYDSTAENNSYDIYIDAVRVYNPAGTVNNTDTASDNISADISSAYVSDDEYCPVFYEIGNGLVNDGDAISNESATDAAVYVDGKQTTVGESIYYNKNYPNNEVYIEPGSAIAFKVNSSIKPVKIQIGLKLIDSTEAGSVTICGKKYTVNSSTEMFYTIDTSWNNNADSFTSGLISINNSSANAISGTKSIISITSIKITYPNDTGAIQYDTSAVSETSVNMMMSYATAYTAYAENANSQSVEPQISLSISADEVEQVYQEAHEAYYSVNTVYKYPRIISASFDDSYIFTGDDALLTVVTDSDVTALTIDGQPINSRYDDGTKSIWSYSVSSPEVGKHSFEITAYNNNGDYVCSYTNLTVFDDSETGEPGEPDEPETFTPDTFESSATSVTIKKGRTSKITVSASADVSYITIRNITSDSEAETINYHTYSIFTKLNKYTCYIYGSSAGMYKYEITAYNSEDIASEPIVVNVTVTNGLSAFSGWIF